ncbi:precorrin-2 C(20)-methyltransferase [Acetobacteraceae bacterium KSS8]|uniref:Precorrin-2 C(20)-methyltransferase n=1 Tax=Endosaccharibacter trunci TaxID=2812733 RepID=A0ABT1W2J4_9PROT|nr:precorrin-2 C(20)-methyltransferase [Acetobacteraceae bacterium KSS8]
MSATGTLQVIGLGPGDPELMTLKAARLIAEASVVAFFARRDRVGHARSIAGDRLRPDATLLRFEYPFTTEMPLSDPRYAEQMTAFYEDCSAEIANHLDRGRDVSLLCEGDPFFYGSAMYLFDRLRERYPHRAVPGVTGMSGCWTAAALPITHGDDVLSVLPGTLSEDALVERLLHCDAAVIMKVGRNLPKIRRALERARLLDRAIYAERGTQDKQRLLALRDTDGHDAPYFSMILVPGRQNPR